MTPNSGTAAPWIARDADAGSYLESFLVWAVAAILVIRAFLELTGYPQLGGGGLHIAHMLWGGLLMLAAIVLLLALLGRRVKSFAAVVGGIGFGTFIDELGKFITSDNDYFFKPTIALIYIIFMLLFLFFRELHRRRELSRLELLANATEVAVEASLGRATQREVDRGLFLLERSRSHGPLANGIRRTLLTTTTPAETSPALVARLRHSVLRGYDRFIRWSWFHRAVVALFVVYAAYVVVFAVYQALDLGPTELFARGDLTVATVAYFLASLASSILIIVGAVRLPSSATTGYRWFKRSILISIFFVQPFLFYENELGALAGLAFDLVLLSGLNYLLLGQHSEQGREQIRQTKSDLHPKM